MLGPLSLLLFSFFPFVMFAQKSPKAGPIIENFGKVYEVAQPDYKTDTTKELRVVFDIGRTFEANDKPNPLIETAARFLNMHAQNDVKPSNMNVALVIHGSASQDILGDEQYRKKFGLDNPNTSLVKALDEAGVAIILCGQTAAYRKITKNDVLPEVQFALSAMTALIQLQNDHYRLINF